MSGGSALNFLGAPMPPERVADAVMAAVAARRPKVERDLPRVEGLLVRAATLVPGLTYRALPLLTRFGERGRRRYATRSLSLPGGEPLGEPGVDDRT